ncbi:MAG TPA: hypothetical protein VN176_19495 [Verrucomicrobiae bacterium]|jgi:hypothetical protein|nr:hypothetical protein [Verrucomicrobiae bacterium]
MAKLLDILFGCWHENYSFPVTIKRGERRAAPAASATGTYVVCLDCGKEFPYDWNEMKVVSEIPAKTKALEAKAQKAA